MAVLRFAGRARLDLLDIHAYIARDNRSVANRWIEKLEQRCRSLATAPEIGERQQKFGTDIRRGLLGRYVIYYRAVAGGIEVARVVAGDRDLQSLS